MLLASVTYFLSYTAHSSRIVQAIPCVFFVFHQDESNERRPCSLGCTNVLHAMDQVNGRLGRNGPTVPENDANTYVGAGRYAAR